MSIERGETPTDEEFLSTLFPKIPKEHWGIAVDRLVLNMRKALNSRFLNDPNSNVFVRGDAERELREVEEKITKWDQDYGELGLVIGSPTISLFDPETEREAPLF